MPVRRKTARKVAKRVGRKKVGKAAKKPARKVRCVGKTMAGKRCRRYVTGKSKFCAAHR